MSTKEFTDSLLREISHLDEVQQEVLLSYARTLVSHEVTGVSGKSLKKFAGSLSQLEANQMIQDIEEGCEQIETHGW
jgi:hypothetical protein